MDENILAEPIDISTFVAWTISVAAVGVAVFSRFLQRIDKKPGLMVLLERKDVSIPKKDTAGNTIMETSPSFTIRLRNQTETTLKVESIQFVDGNKIVFMLPPEWETVSEIPPHGSRTLVLSVIEFEKWARVVNPFKPAKGRFVITDSLANQYKTRKLGNSISLEPVDKS